MCCLFKPFPVPTPNDPESLLIPELTNGFDISLEALADGMTPISFCSHPVPAGTYALSLTLEALQDTGIIYLFTGRKQLRDIISLKAGERYQRVFYQNVCEIIPRYHTEVWPVTRLFVTICTTYPNSLKFQQCEASVSHAKTVYLCGDSTVTDQSAEIPYHPGACYASWGQALPAYLSDSIAVENQAHCGLTTETFRQEGHFALVQKYIRPGDFALFQFGHNDQKCSHLLANREYPVNLTRFIAETRAAGAVPVLVTPLGRNTWNKDSTYLDLLDEHAQAVKDVARATQTPFIDLHGFSVRFLQKHGQEKSCGYFHPGDGTHTNEYGAYLFASFIAGELQRLFPETFTAISRTVNFLPPDRLWNQFTQKNNRIAGESEREQFDFMEKSVDSLLDIIRAAKEG